MLLALGRKKEGESFIAAGLESMTHKEEGFLLALIELKRLRAQPKLIEEYERSLRKLVKEGKITSPLPLIDIHSSCLTAYHYPGMKKETELILEMLKGMTGREFREAE